jgi:hypothetical protein
MADVAAAAVGVGARPSSVLPSQRTTKTTSRMLNVVSVAPTEWETDNAELCRQLEPVGRLVVSGVHSTPPWWCARSVLHAAIGKQFV